MPKHGLPWSAVPGGLCAPATAGTEICVGSSWTSCMFFPFIYKILSLLKQKPFTGLPGLIFAAFFPYFLTSWPANCSLTCLSQALGRSGLVKSGRWIELAQPEVMQVRKKKKKCYRLAYLCNLQEFLQLSCCSHGNRC